MPLGNLYVALVGDDEEFDPVLHARQDFDLVNAFPKWSEKDFWAIDLEIRNPGGGLFRPGKTRVFISEDVDGVVQHSFTGRLQGWPLGAAGETVTVTLKCKPKNHEAVEIAALAGINDDPFYCFSDPDDKRTSDVVLAARSALLHWGRDESAPVLVDLIEGNGFIDIGDAFIEGSLRFDEPGEHISKVEVNVKAEWPQALPVAVDMAGALGDGIFGTLSGPTFEIPQFGETVGDWTIIRSSVAELGIPPGGLSPFSRTYASSPNKTSKVQANTDTGSVDVRFRRRFFDVDLLAASVLTANRRETLKFTLAWTGQEIANYDGLTETVELDCRNMRRDVLSGEAPAWQPGVAVNKKQIASFNGATWFCNTAHVTGGSLYEDFDKWDPLLFDYSPSGGQASSKFFGAPIILQGNAASGEQQLIFRDPTPGWYAFRYALLQARAKLITGVRVVTASFEVPWIDVWNITGRERIRIADPMLPGGEMVGKVTAISADLIDGVATITIAAAPGNGGFEPVPFIPDYAVPTLVNAGIISADLAFDYAAQEAALAAFEHPADADLFELLENDLRTRLNWVLAPTSDTPEFEVTVDVGTLNFDTDQMVDLYS